MNEHLHTQRTAASLTVPSIEPRGFLLDGVDASATRALDAAKTCRTKLLVQIDDLRDSVSDTYANREDRRFFEWAFRGFEGVLALSTGTAHACFHDCLLGLKSAAQLPHAIAISASSATGEIAKGATSSADALVAIHSLSDPFRAAGLSAVAVVIGGNSELRRAVITGHLERGIPVVVLREPDADDNAVDVELGRYTSNGTVGIASSWRDVEAYVGTHYDAFGRSAWSSALSEATLSKQVRPLKRPIEKKFHPVKAELISLSEMLKRDVVLSWVQVALDDPSLNSTSFFQTATNRVRTLAVGVEELIERCESLCVDIPRKESLPHRVHASAFDNIKALFAEIKHLGEKYSPEGASEFARVSDLFVNRTRESFILPTQGTHLDVSQRCIARWGPTWDDCLQISRLLNEHHRHPLDPAAAFLGINLAVRTPEDLQNLAQGGMRFLTIRRAGQVVGSFLYSNRHTAFERADSDFLRQEQRQSGGAPWGFFVAVPSGEQASTFNAIHSFAELAVIAEGNRKVLAVVHPANLPSLTANFGKGWRMTDIEDIKPAAKTFDHDDLHIPAGMQTRLMVVSLTPGDHRRSTARADLEAALRVYCGKREGICPLEKWPVFSEVYVRLHLQREFCHEVREHREGMKQAKGESAQVAHLEALASLAKAPPGVSGMALRKFIQSRLPSSSVAKHIESTCEKRLAELDAVLASRYGPTVAKRIIDALQKPTAAVLEADFAERVVTSCRNGL